MNPFSINIIQHKIKKAYDEIGYTFWIDGYFIKDKNISEYKYAYGFYYAIKKISYTA